MPLHGLINSSNAGELSPLLSSRTDVSQYASGCRTLENYLATPYGAAVRRTGTLYLGTAKYNDKKCRLMSFVCSSSIKYIIEFGHHYIRFIKDDAYILTGDQPYELETPYGSDELDAIKTVPSADVIFLAHPNYFPKKLTRLTESTFSIADLSISFPPLKDPNITSTTITPNGTTGTGVTLTASADLFNASHVGSYWGITHFRSNSQLSGSFSALNQVTSLLKVKGKWNFVSRGTWTGTIQIQKSYDGGSTYIDFRSYSSAADKNFDVTGSEAEKNVGYRLKMSAHTSGKCSYEFRNDDFYNNGAVKITAVTDAKTAVADVIVELGATTATADWNEAAWSDVAGFPKCLALYEERLCFGGTEKQPQTIWCSRTNAWDDFETGSLDDDALNFTVIGGDKYIGEISWLVPHDSLLCGMTASEWKISSSSSEKPLTPSNVTCKKQSNYGSSATIPAHLVGDVILFTQFNGRKVREFTYDFQKDGYVSPDLTVLAEHITEGKILSATLQQQPDNVLWCVRSDGQLAALTYERDQKVVAWHRHTTAGCFESVAIIPDTKDDAVYVSVMRTINNSPVRYIEKFYTREWDDINDYVGCDCAVRRSPIDKLVTELSHLEGQNVQVFGDGAVLPTEWVREGQTTIESDVTSVLIGLPFTSLYSPMPLDLQLQDGTAQFRKKRVSNLRIKMNKSVGGHVKVGNGDQERMITRHVSDEVNAALQPYTGDFFLSHACGFLDDPSIEISQDEPLPHTIVSMSMIYEVHE
jgi:hypothetical protein